MDGLDLRYIFTTIEREIEIGVTVWNLYLQRIDNYKISHTYVFFLSITTAALLYLRQSDLVVDLQPEIEREIVELLLGELFTDPLEQQILTNRNGRHDDE